jgi:hypothetical protein
MTLTPAQIEERLQELEHDLGLRQNAYANAAEKWHRALREREHKHAIEFMRAGGKTVTERKEQARELTALMGITEEAEYEGLKAAIRVMELRSMIGMALLKSAGRA